MTDGAVTATGPQADLTVNAIKTSGAISIMAPYRGGGE